MSEKQTLSQRITERSQEFCQSLLSEFPDLRSVAVVFDYDLEDSGSLPSGVWIPTSRSLQPHEVVKAISAIDKVSYNLRNEHGLALLRAVEGKSKTKNTQENSADE